MSTKDKLITGSDISNQMTSLYHDNKSIAVSAGNRGPYNTGQFGNTIRSEYTRSDYEYYRPNNALPQTQEEAIQMAMRSYKRVGIVRNVIDLMSDFTCKGIRLNHPNPQQERFFNEWWRHINGDKVSERFSNYLYRLGNVVVNTTYGKVPIKIERKWMSSNADEQPVQEIKTEFRRVPLRYGFLNPATIEVFAPEISAFVGRQMYGLRISYALKSAFAKISSQFPSMTQEQISNLIPKNIMDAVNSGLKVIPIDGDNISIHYYKKDDWDVWAEPMLSSIFDDLMLLEQMKLADLSALDGAISNVRLWNLGHMEGDNPNNWVIPQKAMFDKLSAVLSSAGMGGVIDVLWGPDLKFTESDSKLHEFLRPDKYDSALSSIYDGLGVPFGSGGGSKGLGNNFIAMQTFVERLEYGRRVLLNFWTAELAKVQAAMGYSKPAEITFEQINLGDDTTYKNLLVSLLDRDVISVDTVLDSFKFSSVEKKRIQREYQQRRSGKLPLKSSPFHNPDKEHDLKKIILQRGGVAPSEVGLELQNRKDGEKSPSEQEADRALKLAKLNKKPLQEKYSPSAPNGRPEGAKDSTPRKQKVVTVQTKGEFVNLFTWGNTAQQEISNIVTPIVLTKAYNKKNVRSLTTEEFENLESLKFILFSQLKPYTKVDESAIASMLDTATSPNPDVYGAVKILLAQFQKGFNRAPTVDETRQIQSSAFALVYDTSSDTIETNGEEEFDII